MAVSRANSFPAADPISSRRSVIRWSPASIMSCKLLGNRNLSWNKKIWNMLTLLKIVLNGKITKRREINKWISRWDSHVFNVPFKKVFELIPRYWYHLCFNMRIFIVSCKSHLYLVSGPCEISPPLAKQIWAQCRSLRPNSEINAWNV